MMYSVSPEHALKTPAAMFFRLLEEGQKIRNRELSFFLSSLCDVAFYPNLTRDSKERLKEFFKSIGRDDEEEIRRFDLSDKNTAQVLDAMLRI